MRRLALAVWTIGFVASGLSSVKSIGAPAVIPGTIRVCLLHVRRSSTIGCSGEFTYRRKGSRTAVTSRSSINVSPGGRSVKIGSRRLSGTVLVAPVKEGDYLSVNHRRFRGTLVLEPIGRSRLDIIEQVKLDDYLYGVLPREMGSDWPIEALKAQAVVSRTYVLANRAPDPNHGYDLASDVSAQVYGGIEDEAPSALRAVDDTRGMILVDNQGRPVQAFFHSSCGGQTEMPQYVWNYTDTTAPFSSVKDTFCKDDPFAHWAIAVPVKTVQARLRRAGFRISNITAIKAAEKSPSGRVSKFLVTSSRGKARIGANQLRLAIGPEVMRSTLLTNLRLEKKLIFFEGRGWGHGVGLCQWGARGRALAGQNYDAILKAYYPQAQLVHGDPAS